METKHFYGNYVQPALFEETDLSVVPNTGAEFVDTELDKNVTLAALELEKEKWLELYNEAEANLLRVTSEIDALSK